jgi:two-component system, sensor histidine kinase and response regulator
MRGAPFVLPQTLEFRPSQKKEPSPVGNIEGLKVLVIDDNATNRFILREMLSKWNTRVTESESGEQGLNELKRALEEKDPFKLLLLDCRMPGMDGFEVVERINREMDDSGMTIMMLSSDSQNSDIAKCEELGIRYYLVKPIKRDALYETIAAAMGKNGWEPAASPENLRSSNFLKILLVEDTEDNRLLIKSFLKDTAYRLDVAENGAEAVDKFKTETYDLVLMDIQMPVMDGYAATREIRMWETEQNIKETPILALTAFATKDDEKKSLEAGCNAHLTKPIKKTTLLKALQAFSAFDE